MPNTTTLIENSLNQKLESIVGNHAKLVVPILGPRLGPLLKGKSNPFRKLVVHSGNQWSIPEITGPFPKFAVHSGN